MVTHHRHMETIAQRLNDSKPYHDHWQDDSRSVSRLTNRSMVRTTTSHNETLEELFWDRIYAHHIGKGQSAHTGASWGHVDYLYQNSL